MSYQESSTNGTRYTTIFSGPIASRSGMVISWRLDRFIAGRSFNSAADVQSSRITRILPGVLLCMKAVTAADYYDIAELGKLISLDNQWSDPRSRFSVLRPSSGPFRNDKSVRRKIYDAQLVLNSVQSNLKGRDDVDTKHIQH